MGKAQTHPIASQGGRPSAEFQSSTLIMRFLVVNRKNEKIKILETYRNQTFPLQVSAVKLGITWKQDFFILL